MPDACFSVVPSEKGIERRNWLHSKRCLDLVAPKETSLCEMRSQARQQSVALKETTASRFVVAKRILNRGTCGMERVLATKSRRHGVLTANHTKGDFFIHGFHGYTRMEDLWP